MLCAFSFRCMYEMMIIPLKKKCFIFFAEGDVYAGTVADFTEVDPLIHRWDSLRTTQYDLKYLNGKLMPLCA